MKLKEIPGSWLTALRLKKYKPAQLNNPSEAPYPVIVSLTSIPSRLPTINLTIRSLLLQNNKPEKIILWLHNSLQHKLPRTLSDLQGDVFEIRYVDLQCSHRKLIHALEAFPNKIIVTCDDDLMYNSSWLDRLYQDHQRYPQAIIAHECRTITYDKTGAPLPYDQWQTATHNKNFTDKWLMPIGYGGVLYPPKCLYKDVCNRELFLKITPFADDLWFKAMSFLEGTSTRRSSIPGEKPIPIIGSQTISLKKTNVKKNGNYLQWLAVCKHYDIRSANPEDFV